ncbi:hypothetical protein ACQKL5_15265 [Peribacillus sp. NPDC097675]
MHLDVTQDQLLVEEKKVMMNVQAFEQTKKDHSHYYRRNSLLF